MQDKIVTALMIIYGGETFNNAHSWAAFRRTSSSAVNKGMLAIMR